jgi:hypothetical protein
MLLVDRYACHDGEMNRWVGRRCLVAKHLGLRKVDRLLRRSASGIVTVGRSEFKNAKLWVCCNAGEVLGCIQNDRRNVLVGRLCRGDRVTTVEQTHLWRDENKLTMLH